MTMETSTRNVKKWVRHLGDLGVQTLHFANALGGRRYESDRLLVMGTPEFEPWHFVAHLAEEAKRDHRADLIPTLVRWQVPQGAPAHLAVSLSELSQLTRNQTLLVVSSCSDSPLLLERVTDAKKRGARIMAVHRDDEELADISHEMLSVDPLRDDRDFDLTQHLVTDIAPMVERQERRRWARALSHS
jgi:hypothetical protein